jgi:hypothetical protein
VALPETEPEDVHGECAAEIRRLSARAPISAIDIVFDGPPGAESGRFVEVEDGLGNSISIGEWLQRPDGYWVLRLDVVR